MLFSCEKKNENTGTGTAEFSVSMLSDAGSKSALSDSTVAKSYQLMISVEDLTGKAIFTDKLIPLYSFGTSYISESVEIPSGEFKLTKFMVINTSGAVIYASPLAGSPLAYLTKKPLPFNFKIYSNQTTKVLPEVLAVADHTPDKFGYASFGVQVIKPVEFWTMAVLDPGNPEIMAPIQITNANLTVISQDGWRFTFNLEATVNHLIIRGGSETYNFILQKEGYQPITLQFGIKDLLATTNANPLILKIPWSSQLKVIYIQPGPEKGKDAMVSNLESEKNFGDHKYFEATFLSEPVLTVMRSNRSMIAFNLDTVPKTAIIQRVALRLAYDIPIPFDPAVFSTTVTVPTAGYAWYGGVLQQITESWDEHKVTWNTQPKSIETNQVFIPPFIKNANFIEVDVTKLFTKVPTATAGAVIAPNYGLLFKLWPTDKFPGFRFASSDYPDAGMRPKLAVWYMMP